MLYRATVTTEKDPLRVRQSPGTGRIIGHVPRGAEIEVLADKGDGWPRIRYNELVGYASGDYLTRVEDTGEGQSPDEGIHVMLILTDSAGNEWNPIGDFSARLVAAED